MKTLTEQYKLIKEDKGHKGVFLKEAKKLYPNLIRQGATFNEASTILKQKNIISENFVGLGAINNPFEVKEKEGYEKAFENFLKEAEVKAEEKKVSKEVEEDQEHAYDSEDKKDPNNMIFDQIQTGVYFEAKQEKNADKTIDQIRDIVYKNLEKDPIYYTKNGQFGVGVGYTDDNVSLGIPKEPKGKYKSSGYGNLKENKNSKPINEHTISLAGGIVTGGAWKAPTLEELLGEVTDEDIAKQEEYNTALEKTAELSKEAGIEEDMQAPYYMSELADAAEEAYDQGGLSIDEIVNFIQQHLGGKYGDY
tara:strand:- start:953 stop:1873 length:921 start_codon:yes stop_codon:yes gene_type:complete